MLIEVMIRITLYNSYLRSPPTLQEPELRKPPRLELEIGLKMSSPSRPASHLCRVQRMGFTAKGLGFRMWGLLVQAWRGGGLYRIE